MDWELQAARWVLCSLSGEDLVAVATTALVEGFDTPSLRLLAAESRPTAVDAGPMFESVLLELGVVRPGHDEAVRILARDVARSVVDGASRRLALLSYETPTARELLVVFVGIDSEFDDFSDQVRLDYYGAEHCARVRERCREDVVAACKDLIAKVGFQAGPCFEASTPGPG